MLLELSQESSSNHHYLNISRIVGEPQTNEALADALYGFKEVQFNDR